MAHPGIVSAVTGHARSGALSYAWRLFHGAALDTVQDDPAVLSLRGRLLKDSARAAAGPEQQRLYREAGDTYARAGALDGSTYPLINAATLAFLAGDREAARTRATDVLTRAEDPQETPYYQAATRAEALLLLGRTDEAQVALAEAMARAPRAWEDHASTLRQFALILEEMGEDAGWLERLRPPRSLHFAGHMALAAESEALDRRIRAVLEQERVGFGFGALAAGADIVIAEALLEHGAELHLVLPAAPKAFRRASVEGFEGDWAKRFEAVIARAETVRSTREAADRPNALDIELAAEAAMGAAVMHARMLTSEAVQLLVLDDAGEAEVSGLIRAIWAQGGRRQHVLAAPRQARGRGEAASVQPAPRGAVLAALLAIVPERRVRPDADSGAALLARLVDLVAAGPAPLLPPLWSGEQLTLAFACPAEAAAAALRIVGALGEGARVGGHYAVVETGEDPFRGGSLLLGEAARRPASAAASAPPGAVHLTQDFAEALSASATNGLHLEYVGDLPSAAVGPAPGGAQAIGLFSLRASPSAAGA